MAEEGDQLMNLTVHFFKCQEEAHKAFGKWGFKVKEYKGGGWFTTHKTRYEFITREEAMQAAKAYVNENHPGQWIEKKSRRSPR